MYVVMGMKVQRNRWMVGGGHKDGKADNSQAGPQTKHPFTITCKRVSDHYWTPLEIMSWCCHRGCHMYTVVVEVGWWCMLVEGEERDGGSECEWWSKGTDGRPVVDTRMVLYH